MQLVKYLFCCVILLHFETRSLNARIRLSRPAIKCSSCYLLDMRVYLPFSDVAVVDVCRRHPYRLYWLNWTTLSCSLLFHLDGKARLTSVISVLQIAYHYYRRDISWYDDLRGQSMCETIYAHKSMGIILFNVVFGIWILFPSIKSPRRMHLLWKSYIIGNIERDTMVLRSWGPLKF